jgi:hypothetical protein
MVLSDAVLPPHPDGFQFAARDFRSNGVRAHSQMVGHLRNGQAF